jgi:hypothetical protein
MVPRMPIVLANSTANRITLRDMNIHGKPSRNRKTLMSRLWRLRRDMESPDSDMTTSPPLLTSSGKLEAVLQDHRRKIGSTRQNNSDPAVTPTEVDLPQSDDYPRSADAAPLLRDPWMIPLTNHAVPVLRYRIVDLAPAG